MQLALLCVTGAALFAVMRRILFLRGCGCPAPARRLYMRAAWCLGITAYAAMAAQELILLLDGRLRWSNALPLHLCSLMGLLTLPMLLTRRRMLWHWSLFLGIPGAALALPHPLTILAAFLAAPLTTLHPALAAGWVAGLVEAWLRPPAVADFEALPQALESLRGFWRNPVIRILLVVVTTNIGASIGTFVAIPWIAAR